MRGLRGLVDLILIILVLDISGCVCEVSVQLAVVKPLVCTPGKARLVNGTHEDEGVLEICTDGSAWSTVCSNYISCNERAVACRQAGYDEARTAYTNYTAGRLNPPKLGFYSCSGTETSLSECSKRTGLTLANNCGYAAGLKCSKAPEQDEKCAIQNAVRLFGGSKRSEGQLQICRNQKWRDVCDSSSDSQALGYIACRELGYTGNWVSTAHNRHYYNATTTPSFYARIRCYNKNYAKTSYCSIYENCEYCFGQETAITCEIEKTNCKERDIRLVGGPTALEGWVEMCVDGIWGRITGKVEGQAKDLMCSQMGFNETGATVISRWSANSLYESVNSPALVKYINCCDRDKTFQTCDVHYAKVTDSLPQNQEFALRCIDGCTNGAMKLTGGDSKHEGTVEMCVSGIWRAVGLTNWDDTDANVVCQHLYPGQKYAYAVATNSSEFETSARNVYYDNLRCNGAELSTNNCGKNYAFGFYTSEYTAAVKCHPVCDCKQ